MRVPSDLLERIDDEAERSGASRASTIRRLLVTSLDGNDSGVDIAQIQRALARTPRERVRSMVATEHVMAQVRGRAVT